MIGIVSLNMSLDRIYMVDSFDKGEVSRVQTVINMAGGKGTHVANICHELGAPYVLTGFIAGTTGQKIQLLLDKDQMNYDFIEVPGDTRSCLNIISKDDGSQTEFLESGLYISAEDLAKFMEAYAKLCTKCKVIVISGSGYKNMPVDFYGQLCQLAKQHGCMVIVDASGQTLVEALPYLPTVIKPNKDEVKVFSTGEDNRSIIESLLSQGIVLPIISQGAKGAIAGYEGKVYSVQNPKVEAVNCVGSGDAFIGGLAVGLHDNLSIIDTLKLACACGTANALQLESGRIAKADVEELLARTIVEELV